MKDDRRAFLLSVGGVSAAVAGASALGARADALPEAVSRGGGDGLAAAAAVKPGFQVTKFALELEGKLIGFLRSFSGGHASAEVVQEDGGSDCVVRKGLGLGSVHYADLVLSLASQPGPEVQDWILEMLSCGKGGRSGAILSLDLNFKELRRLEFKNAVLTEVTLPALDAAAKEAFFFTLRCQPDATNKVKGSGEKVNIPPSKEKVPLSSNFRLTIKGLDATRVTRVESLKITRTLIPAESAGKAFSIPGKVDVGDLVVTLPESDADFLSKWHQSFVIEGTGDEMQGTIELLAPNLKSTLFDMQLAGLGIYSLGGASPEAGQDSIGKVVARMYCEEVGFKF